METGSWQLETENSKLEARNWKPATGSIVLRVLDSLAVDYAPFFSSKKSHPSSRHRLTGKSNIYTFIIELIHFNSIRSHGNSRCLFSRSNILLFGRNFLG